VRRSILTMRVLVAGGAGYIGSHTCKALAEAGHTPIVYDNLDIGHKWAVKWGAFELVNRPGFVGGSNS
jgi:UDP-glucose 4-epimerase